MSTDSHRKAFAAIIGDKNVLNSAEDMAGYEQGWRGERGKAALVLRPRTTDEISRLSAYAAAHGLTVIPQGANTGLVGASVPDTSGTQIIISLSRMTDILAIDPLNRTAHVQAGCRLSKLNAALEEHGLYFPVDLGADPTIGGMLATNTGGGRLVKYGGVRENTLGLQAVLHDTDGTTIDMLCPLRKNNTGLDLKQLFIGTGGTLGIVTECMVNLAALPQQIATALLVPRTPDGVNIILREVERHAGATLSAMELMSAAAIERALTHSPNTPNPFGPETIPPYVILLELAREWPARDGEQPLAQALEQILSLIWAHPDEPLETALMGDSKKLWALRHALSEGVQKSGKLIAFDISFRRGDVVPFLIQMYRELPDKFPKIAICDFGHIGDGGIHFNLVLDRTDPRADNQDFETELRSWVYDKVVYDYEGSYSAEHGLGPKNQAFYDRYTAENIDNLTRALKNTLLRKDIKR